MCRDLILSLFTKSDTVDVSEISAKTRIRTSRILEYLENVANQVKDSSTLWKWKRAEDTAASFSAKFPVVTAEEEKWWAKRELEINALFAASGAEDQVDEDEEESEDKGEVIDERGIE
jgi:hypothetical protein